MSKWYTFLFILLLTTNLSWANPILLSGTVSRDIEITQGKRITFKANSNLLLESQSSTGQRELYYLQYNKKLRLERSKISKVTIYAP